MLWILYVRPYICINLFDSKFAINYCCRKGKLIGPTVNPCKSSFIKYEEMLAFKSFNAFVDHYSLFDSTRVLTFRH